MSDATLAEIKSIIVEQDKRAEGWVNKVNERLDFVEKNLEETLVAKNRPSLSGAARDTAGYTRKLGTAMRKAALGDDAEIKSMSAGSDPDGGYLVIPAMDSMVRQIRDIISPLSGLVRNVDLDSGSEMLLPYSKGTLPTGWTGESDSRPNTGTVGVGEHRIALCEVYANPQISQKLLDTANYDVGAILTDQITHGLAAAEAEALHNGDGILRPRGFTTIATSTDDDASRAFDTIQYVPTGSAGAFAASTASGVLLDVIAALKPQYRANAKWFMSRATASTLWKIKIGSTDDRPMWQQSIQAGQPASLFGYPVVISDNVPAIAGGSLSIWFGDWQQAYTTIRMPGIKLLRDPYTTKGQVNFYAYARVGGMVTNCEAVKVLKFAAS